MDRTRNIPKTGAGEGGGCGAVIEQTAVNSRYSDAVDSNNGNDYENVKSILNSL